MGNVISHRYDFVLYFDVRNGNPNGDPDAGNLPRIDPESSRGIVSDVCLKRKVRNYVDLVKNAPFEGPDASEGELGYKIYVQEGAVLNERNQTAYDHQNIKKTAKKLPKNIEEQAKVTQFMCRNFYDIRTFGAVMTTEVNCGQVRGPIQICFAESVDPIVPLEMSITRMAATKANEDKDNKTMGRKQYVPYGLYRAEGFVSASLAERTGFSEVDLDLFFEALMNMFENDRSSARGLMSSRLLVVFKHESKLGNAPAYRLFDMVHSTKTCPANQQPHSFDDYCIKVDEQAVPAGVTIKQYDYIAPSA
ncbi:MAG: type I-C CRISPR-associated protein Cas7/Csd2 [Coriobacteriales bacterium]|nr:type I-C CRISPR-associated protein Cas7/Csd2 [Coriobacteriales bacterium]